MSILVGFITISSQITQVILYDLMSIKFKKKYNFTVMLSTSLPPFHAVSSIDYYEKSHDVKHHWHNPTRHQTFRAKIVTRGRWRNSQNEGGGGGFLRKRLFLLVRMIGRRIYTNVTSRLIGRCDLVAGHVPPPSAARLAFLRQRRCVTEAGLLPERSGIRANTQLLNPNWLRGGAEGLPRRVLNLSTV